MPHGEGPLEKSVAGPGATAGRGRTGAWSTPSSPSPSPERKETRAATRAPGGQAAGATSAPTKGSAVSSPAPRSTWTEQPRTRGTEPARPPGKAARTPVPGSQDKVRPSTGVRPVSRAAETRAPPKAPAQATPASGRARTPRAARSGPDPGDEYSMDAGPPHTVSDPERGQVWGPGVCTRAGPDPAPPRADLPRLPARPGRAVPLARAPVPAQPDALPGLGAPGPPGLGVAAALQPPLRLPEPQPLP